LPIAVRDGWRRYGILEKVKVAEKFDVFSDYWDPKIVAELYNSCHQASEDEGLVRSTPSRERG
jgi:hypothetical protein